MKNITSTLHSLSKIEILKHHGFSIKWSLIIDMLRDPGRIHPGYGNRKVAEKVLNKKIMIRIIFSGCNSYMKIITPHPYRRSINENKNSNDEDILMVELSGENILHTEEYGPIIMHYSKNDRPVLLEMLDAGDHIKQKI